ncbi:HPr kinase/phosphatase C-terminal domain-containing protein [Ruegeria sp. R13_0]|uniref:HPr kinase/phosphorylase n=1 Tax=Ruegeria sp. R13_0 TaxID=2821099 RepID=UPI001AD986E1|nr:HPr kinase/phosphatase C-terminal domain-containing protein [Ruegeria sp. R13_0]MBO9436029.1 HPr kinase/phosphatase C-terminal domain-containing protein [Ruegeria sp. R13_0]
MSSQTLSDIADKDSACVHATCVAVQGRGLLIVGASGSGKSSLALRMIALGADLVADDRVNLRRDAGAVIADAQPQISGLIEARGIGLLRAAPCGPVALDYVLDMDQKQPARLPEPVTLQLLGHYVALLFGAGVPNLAEALMQLLKMGRVDPEWTST